MTEPNEPNAANELLLPNDLQVCMPATGFIPEYIRLCREQNTLTDPVVTLATVIPLMLYDLNVRGFGVEGLSHMPGVSAPFNVMSLILAPSGTGKSTSAGSFQRIWEQATGREHPAVIPLEGTTAGIVRSLEGFYDPRADHTCAVLYADEFSSVLKTIKASQHAHTMPQLLNTILKGDTYKKVLKGSAESTASDRAPTVRKPKISGVCYSVPEALNSGIFDDDMASTGFLARMLVFLSEAHEPSLMPLRKMFKPVPRDHFASCVELYKQWLNWLDLWVGKGETNIRVSEAAFAEFDSMIEQLKENFDQSGNAVKSAMRRAESKAYVIAALYATTRGSQEISLQDANVACNLVWEGLTAVTKLAGKGLGSDGATEVERTERGRQDRLLQALLDARQDGLSRSQLYYTKHGVIATNKRALDVILDTLTEQGLITSVFPDPERAGKPGPPTTRYWAIDHVPKKYRKGKPTHLRIVSSGEPEGVGEEAVERAIEKLDEKSRNPLD